MKRSNMTIEILENAAVEVVEEMLASTHQQLSGDQAYDYSIENNDPLNMQLVLRAYDKPHTLEDAFSIIEYANK